MFDVFTAVRFLTLVIVFALAAAETPAQELLEPGKAFGVTAKAVGPTAIRVRFAIAPGYYLYRDKIRFRVEPGGAAPMAVVLPPGKLIEDAFFGRVLTYRGRVEVALTLPDDRRGQTVRLVVDSQGCADIGVCYPPFRQELQVRLPTTRLKTPQ